MYSQEQLRPKFRGTVSDLLEAKNGKLDTRVEPGPFTLFMLAWEPNREPEPALAAALWSELGRVLRQELHRRSLGQASPQWLGIYGFQGWWEAASRGGPFDELLAEAYRYVFAERFPALKAQTEGKADIDGVVRASIRHFLHDRQRQNDRLGTRLFEVMSLAVRRAVARGDLTHVAGAEKVGSSSVFTVGERVAPADPAPRETLAPIVQRWSDDLLPGLVTASRADKRRLVEELARRLAELELAGVAVFRFGDLIAPLRADVRARWAALFAPAEEEPPDEEDARRFRRLRGGFEPTVEMQVIAADRFAKLIDCLDRAIEASRETERTCDYLRRILLFIRAYSTEEAIVSAELGSGPDQDRLPSFRRLADHLKIPRDRFSGLMETLKGALERCRRRLDGELARVRAGGRWAEEVGP